jgi:hypothetical protein
MMTVREMMFAFAAVVSITLVIALVNSLLA